MEKNSNQPLNQAERYQYLIGLTEGKQLDADYRAAFYILSSVPEMFEAAAKCVDHEGITFDKIKRLCKGKLEESQMHLLSLAHNVFAWNSRVCHGASWGWNQPVLSRQRLPQRQSGKTVFTDTSHWS